MSDPSQVPLSLLLPMEWACGIVSASLMAPFVAIIDTSISANAGGVRSLKDALKEGFKMLFTKPATFLRWRPFHIILGVYGATYVVANSVDTLCHYQQRDPFYPKFLFTSATNVAASVYKETQFTRIYSTVVGGPLPLSSKMLFCGRDSLTILASFNLPGIISKKLQANFHVNPTVADVGTQLTLPCVVQFASAPLYLLGSHLYNVPTATTAQRSAFIWSKYLGTSLARVARIFPAFGVGGVANKFLRSESRKLLDRHQATL